MDHFSTRWQDCIVLGFLAIIPSSSLIQSRKCSISSWKSIITAWIWNQINAHKFTFITGSLFPENMSAKISNKCTQVHIFLSLLPGANFTQKNHRQNLLPEYCMEGRLHQQCKCHLGLRLHQTGHRCLVQALLLQEPAQ